MLFICKIAWVLVNIYLFTSCPVWDIFCLIYMKIYINSGGSLKELVDDQTTQQWLILTWILFSIQVTKMVRESSFRMTEHMEGLGKECSWEGAHRGGLGQTELIEVYSNSAEISGNGW